MKADKSKSTKKRLSEKLALFILVNMNGEIIIKNIVIKIGFRLTS